MLGGEGVTLALDRRMALAGLAAGTLAAIPLASAKSGAARPVLDTTSPAGRQRTFLMMRGALDNRLVSSWVSARYYGVVEDRMDPLFAVVSAVFARHRPLPDGSVEVVSAELAWFTDAETGKALDTWRNPYTGKDVKVPIGGLKPTKFRFGPDLSLHLGREVPGMELAHEVLPFDVRGDDVWVTERSRTAVSIPGAPRPFRYSESNTFHARRRDLEAPGATRVTSDVSYTNVCSWRPWLEMGDRPGHLTATGIGRQGATLDSLPPSWIEATAARRPEVLKDPAALLAPLWNAG